MIRPGQTEPRVIALLSLVALLALFAVSRPAVAQPLLLPQDLPSQPPLPPLDLSDQALPPEGLIPTLPLPLNYPGQFAPLSLFGPPLPRGGAGQATPSKSAPQWMITADRLSSDNVAEIVEAWGDVTLWQDYSFLKAEYARYFTATGWVFLSGDVEIKMGGEYITGAEAEFDLRNEVGWITRGTVFTVSPHMRVEGETLHKIGPNTYEFENARLTSCDAQVAPWSLSARDGTITMDGTAELSNLFVNVFDQPVLYLPHATLPMVSERQSGLLVPEFGVSKRLGAQIIQPYYYVIDEERDLTVYENYMAQRGLMHGLEYRQATDPLSRGLWRIDWLDDSETAKTEKDEPTAYQGDGLARPNSSRFWLRSKYNGYALDPAWKLKLDLDYVSDQNYLREFKQGLSGYNSSRNEFLNEFSRDIAVNDALLRTSTLLVSRDWREYGVSAQTAYTENLSYRNGNLTTDQNPTIQTLPQIQTYAFRDGIGDTPLEWEGTGTYNYFWREYGTTGSRLDLHPIMALPFDLGPVAFISKAGWRQTAYGIDRLENEDADISNDTARSRGVPDFSTQAFTEYYRVFDLAGSDLEAGPSTLGKEVWSRLKHSIQPRVQWDYVPSVDQSSLPRFDSLDRISPANEVTYSLTNILTRRQETVVARPGKDMGDLDYVLSPSYLDVVNLRISQTYDLREASRNDQLDEYERRPFSDVQANLTLNYDQNLSLTNRTFLSPYDGDITRHDHYFRYIEPERYNGFVGISYLYDTKALEREQILNEQWLPGATIDPSTGTVTVTRFQPYNILSVGGEVFVNRGLLLGTTYNFDLRHDTDIEKQIYLTFREQCYSANISYYQTAVDTRYEMRVDLLGLSLF